MSLQLLKHQQHHKSIKIYIVYLHFCHKTSPSITCVYACTVISNLVEIRFHICQFSFIMKIEIDFFRKYNLLTNLIKIKVRYFFKQITFFIYLNNTCTTHFKFFFFEVVHLFFAKKIVNTIPNFIFYIAIQQTYYFKLPTQYFKTQILYFFPLLFLQLYPKHFHLCYRVYKKTLLHRQSLQYIPNIPTLLNYEIYIILFCLLR
ncbi:hypothetical protein RFI_13362 [Reticulomyxa filosa]|uniref:Transmembrane protein n=1 Tax=Reticulomyxa filosa TaxID=46433 RepID=X6ND41_RETFI|nr:hypothetical protein RFI_13362 [Reticulomyxa filosa]|eukprot:ETO23813.1 hypothetical protein RFI_13362 [Reticulomyxa filosa]